MHLCRFDYTVLCLPPPPRSLPSISLSLFLSLDFISSLSSILPSPPLSLLLCPLLAPIQAPTLCFFLSDLARSLHRSKLPPVRTQVLSLTMVISCFHRSRLKLSNSSFRMSVSPVERNTKKKRRAGGRGKVNEGNNFSKTLRECSSCKKKSASETKNIPQKKTDSSSPEKRGPTEAER